jgi:hypothetical protein
MWVISSSRPLHVLEVSRAMTHVMDPELQEIDRELAVMFRRYLTVRDLHLRVFVVAEQLGKSCVKGKSRGSLLEWFHINWPQRKVALLPEPLGTSELVTRRDS